jgi:hypothetical protein
LECNTRNRNAELEFFKENANSQNSGKSRVEEFLERMATPEILEPLELS